MRIFVILSRIPYPLEKGDKLRAFQQIKHLSQNNEIILFALNDRKIDQREAFQFLQPYCRSVNFFNLSYCCRMINVIRAFISGKPLQVGYFYSRRARKKIKQLIQEYQPDHLYFQLLRTAEYSKGHNIPKTIDYQDAFSKGLQRRMKFANIFQKIIFRIEYKRLLKYERKIFKWFDNKTIISKNDRKEIKHPDKSDIKIISNGVDFDYYQPQNIKKKYDLIFSGNMNYPPNILGARYLVKNVLPLLRQKGLDIKLVIAGADPADSIKAMAKQNIEVTGMVEDLRTYYASSKIFVAPMQIGTGLQNKLLEAMSMEIPCITTPLTNQALKATHNNDIIIANTAEDFANHIEFLLKNQNIAEDIGKKGRIFVKENFTWEKAGEKLEKLMQ